MGLNYRKRIRLGKNSGINLSKSGVSLSQKVGPVTFNSRGRTTVRLGGGFSYTLGRTAAGCGCLFVTLGILAFIRYFWLALLVVLGVFIFWRAFRNR